MNVLAIGGSGIVGTLVLPTIMTEHRVRVFDLAPSAHTDVEFVSGNVTDYDAVRAATRGMDAVLYMAMGSQKWREWSGSESAFDVNVKGVHFALRAAAEAGIEHAVYCSTMSVFADLKSRYFPDEDVVPDEPNIYGFTKWIGEEVCRNAYRRWGLNVNALRLCLPVSIETWIEKVHFGEPSFMTAADDVGRAMLAALRFEGGFQTFMISGDYEEKIMSLAKARKLLGWAPLARPADQPAAAADGRTEKPE